MATARAGSILNLESFRVLLTGRSTFFAWFVALVLCNPLQGLFTLDQLVDSWFCSGPIQFVLELVLHSVFTGLQSC